MPRVDYVILCDEVRLLTDGRYSLIGIPKMLLRNPELSGKSRLLKFEGLWQVSGLSAFHREKIHLSVQNGAGRILGAADIEGPVSDWGTMTGPVKLEEITYDLSGLTFVFAVWEQEACIEIGRVHFPVAQIPQV